MENFTKAATITVGASLITVGIILLFLLLGPLVGALSGWVFSVIFPETVALAVTALGVPFSFWQIGALLGFIGAFFRTVVKK